MPRAGVLIGEQAPLPNRSCLAVTGDSSGKLNILDTSSGVLTPIKCQAFRTAPGAACQCLVNGTVIDADKAKVPLVCVHIVFLEMLTFLGCHCSEEWIS